MNAANKADHRIRHALASMPYGGLAWPGLLFPYPHEAREGALSSEFIAERLEQLADTLRAVAEQNREKEERLNRLEADLGAVGRIFKAAVEEAAKHGTA